MTKLILPEPERNRTETGNLFNLIMRSTVQQKGLKSE